MNYVPKSSCKVRKIFDLRNPVKGILVWLLIRPLLTILQLFVTVLLAVFLKYGMMNMLYFISHFKCFEHQK